MSIQGEGLLVLCRLTPLPCSFGLYSEAVGLIPHDEPFLAQGNLPG